MPVCYAVYSDWLCCYAAGYAGWPYQLRWMAMLVMLFIYTGNAAYDIWPCWLVLLAILAGFSGYAGLIILLATPIYWLVMLTMLNVYGVYTGTLAMLATLDGWLKLLDSYTDYASLLSMEDMLAAWLYSICRLVN